MAAKNSIQSQIFRYAPLFQLKYILVLTGGRRSCRNRDLMYRLRLRRKRHSTSWCASSSCSRLCLRATTPSTTFSRCPPSTLASRCPDNELP